MLENKSILAIIPARGGSKGIKRKNLRLLKGRSLLARTIATAKQSQFIDRLIVSSEDEEIISAAVGAGAEVPFIRPADLALDDTPGTAPILHALMQLPDYDYVVVLQATSPLRTVGDIDGCLQFIITKNANACVTVTEAEVSPHWMFQISHQQQLSPVMPGNVPMRRQDLPATYLLNGAIYIARSKWLMETQTFLSPETLAYVMPKERSIDVDTELDWQLVELYMNDLA